MAWDFVAADDARFGFADGALVLALGADVGGAVWRGERFEKRLFYKKCNFQKIALPIQNFKPQNPNFSQYLELFLPLCSPSNNHEK